MSKATRKRRVLSGLGAAKKGKKSGCKRVSRAAARRKSGPNKGRLKPGCRYLKGDGAECCPTGGKRSKKKTSRKKTSRKKTSRKKTAKKTAKKLHVYSGNPKRSSAFKKGKGGKRVLKKSCSRIRSGANKGKVGCTRKVGRRR